VHHGVEIGPGLFARALYKRVVMGYGEALFLCVLEAPFLLGSEAGIVLLLAGTDAVAGEADRSVFLPGRVDG